MDRGLQEIVDALSLSLGRPVLIDDAELSPLAYSSQFGELDDVRTASILGRHAPDDARVALFDEGIPHGRGAVHIPARPDIGMRRASASRWWAADGGSATCGCSRSRR